MHLIYRFWNLQRPIDILPGVSRRKIFQLYQISIVFKTLISRSTGTITIRYVVWMVVNCVIVSHSAYWAFKRRISFWLYQSINLKYDMKHRRWYGGSPSNRHKMAEITIMKSLEYKIWDLKTNEQLTYSFNSRNSILIATHVFLFK